MQRKYRHIKDFEKELIEYLKQGQILRETREKYGLLSIIKRKKYRNYGESLYKYPNLLNRDFSAERPNQKWVTDISYIKDGLGFLHLSLIRNLHDNSIVAYKAATEQNTNLVLSTIREAKKGKSHCRAATPQ